MVNFITTSNILLVSIRTMYIYVHSLSKVKNVILLGKIDILSLIFKVLTKQSKSYVVLTNACNMMYQVCTQCKIKYIF